MLSQEERKARRREQKRVSGRRWYENNREKHREQQLRWREKNRESERLRKKKWREDNPERKRLGDRDYKYRKKYGITSMEVSDLLLKQEGRCGICNTPDPGSKFGWHVDHDHVTGVVRGILCCHCNHMLGHSKDDPKILEAAIEYLKKKEEAEAPSL